jgi:hypothetical protein
VCRHALVVGRDPQPAAELGLLQRAPRAVAHRRERRVGAQRQPDELQHRRSQARAVGDDHTDLTRPQRCQERPQSRHHPGQHVGGGLGPRDQARLVLSQPRGILPREPLLELDARQPGALPHGVLPQSRVHLHGHTGQRRHVCRGLTRAREVRGPDPAGAQGRDERSHRLRLRVPDLVEGDVGMALGTFGEVPVGPAVAHQHKFARVPRREPAHPGRHSRSVGGVAARTPCRRRDRLVEPQLHGRAVPPQPLELVEGALLLVLDVHDDVAEVDEDPAVVTPALATQRLGAGQPDTLLDLVDDRTDLTFVGRRGDDEDVGEGQLTGDVDGDDVLGLLLGRADCCGSGEVDGSGCGAHGFLGW